MNSDSVLTIADEELLEKAREAVRRNYDAAGERHTVGCALRCSSGKVYSAVNVYHIHGACAEVVAIGIAVTAGERDFVAIVAVRGPEGEEILPPCGNCRQILMDYAPDCQVILPGADRPTKVAARELLPTAYHLYP